ncbi:MAG: T9SS type A sorting domain-containing protein [Bacteroidetes bacterium]|nr:T9SS type A sorting domain-containing protein [Bacteroidota bacterium]
MIKFLLTIGFVLTAWFAHAQIQNQCVDSSRIDPYFQCNDPTFYPVCGCNGHTYRNECVAFRNAGINQIAYQGVCMEEFFFTSAYPNVVTAELNLYVQFYQLSPASIQIRDVYGKLMYSQNYLNIDSRQFTFQVSDYRPGIYFISLHSGEVFTYVKFIKI